MIRGRTALCLWTALALSGVMLGEVGCASKQLSSSSGDQSMTTKGQAPTEAIQPDRVASIEPPADNKTSRIQEARTNQIPPTTPGSGLPSSNAASLSDKSSVNAPDSTGIGDIYFDFDQYNVRADAQPVLERNGQWMRNESGKSLLIEGHCDERGTLAYNLVLGEKRAKSAKRYLENLGIPSSRLHTTSYGEVKPACKEHNEGCWKYNRRAHFVMQ
jgi:peptidoglycan-associated lipoprotein